MEPIGVCVFRRMLLPFLLCFLLMLQAPASFALTPSAAGENRTLSPYFLVKSGDAAIDQLPLKSTRVEVRIEGVIADVAVTQTYANNGKTPLEAVYVFPASTRAAVHGMKMTVGDRVVTAKIEKREEARRQYEQARQEGKSASLLEQQRPNVFQMNLANIMPGDEIEVELRYTELIVPEDGVYEFVYPTVVGPRYSHLPESKATPSDQWIANPTLHQGEAPTSTFDISVDIAGGMPVKDVACASHETDISFDGPRTAVVRLDPKEAYGGNRDFILRYRLDDNKIQTGLLLQQGEEENYFLLMMQPPKRVAPEHIPGREYIFIVDVSGSMRGFPLDTSKELLRSLIGKLRESDRFNVLLFSGSSAAMAEQSLPATQENVRKAIHLIERQSGGGSTELLPALKHALSLPRTKDYSRSVVIVTDGYVTVEEEAFDLIRNHLDQANMFAFGIGSSVNRHLIEGMARVGGGEPFVITKSEEAKAEAERFRKMIESPVLTGIAVGFDGFAAYEVEPVKVPDILAERPVLLFGKWRGKPTGEITIKGTSGSGPFTETVDVEKFAPSAQASALDYLWARHRIALLSDYNRLKPNDRRIEEITGLGLKYNLLTAYTSFVAIDSEARNEKGDRTTVRQPLPMPAGVSDSAVPMGTMPMASTPSPVMPMSMAKRTISADFLFDFDKAVLRPEDMKKLDEMLAEIKSMKIEVIIVVGHTDRIEGRADRGMRLGEQRTAAVKNYLIGKGVPDKRIYVESKGNTQPLTGAQCEGLKKAKRIACLRPDRRVEMEIIAIP